MVFVLVFIFNGFFIKIMIVGKYKNINFENNFIAEQANISDVLEIYPNGKFYSPFYGEGTYKLNYSIGGTKIDLNPDNENIAGLNTTISRKYFLGVPKINLFSDLDVYYIKFE